MRGQAPTLPDDGLTRKYPKPDAESRPRRSTNKMAPPPAEVVDEETSISVDLDDDAQTIPKPARKTPQRR